MPKGIYKRKNVTRLKKEPKTFKDPKAQSWVRSRDGAPHYSERSFVKLYNSAAAEIRAIKNRYKKKK